jgi:hypothetical protein
LASPKTTAQDDAIPTEPGIGSKNEPGRIRFLSTFAIFALPREAVIPMGIARAAQAPGTLIIALKNKPAEEGVTKKCCHDGSDEGLYCY